MCWHSWFYLAEDKRVCQKCGLVQEDFNYTCLYADGRLWLNEGTVDDPQKFIEATKAQWKQWEKDADEAQKRVAEKIIPWQSALGHGRLEGTPK